MPFSMWRVMFSITTMASSTTKPVEMVSAIKREIVEAVAEQVHHREGADQRNRHGDRGNQRGARVAQEDKHHHHHQADGDHQRALDVLHGSADGGGAVEHDGGFDAFGDGGLDRRQLAADVFNRLDDVGAGLAEDDDRDGGLAVEIAGGTDVLHRVGTSATSERRTAAPLW